MLSFYNSVRYFIEISVEKQNKCGDRSHYGVVVVAVVGSREEIRKKIMVVVIIEIAAERSKQ